MKITNQCLRTVPTEVVQGIVTPQTGTEIAPQFAQQGVAATSPTQLCDTVHHGEQGNRGIYPSARRQQVLRKTESLVLIHYILTQVCRSLL